MARVLITGGAGYQGLKLAEALLERGHAVTVLDSFLYGSAPALFLFRYPKVGFVRKDIRSLDEADVRDHDCVYHLAALSGFPACEANPHSSRTINVEGTARLLAALSRQQLLVYASTTSLYGRSGTGCTEESPITPTSLYAATKYEAEQRCLERENSVALRFATIFGVAPRMRWDLLPNEFVMRAVQERVLVLFDSRSVRTFLHIEDAVLGYLMALDQPGRMVGRVFNVGCEAMNLSKLQLAHKIREQVEFSIVDSDVPDLDVRSFVVNFDRITALGFKPRKSLEEGIAELVKLFRFHRPFQAYRVV